MVLNLVIALGMLYRKPSLAWCLAPMTLVFVVAVFSAAEFSSALGLLIALVCVAVRLRRLDLLKWSVVALPVAIVALWPTIAPRIEDFSSLHGMPTSWLVRYHNLSTYFWPPIVDGTNFLVGVRPAARVPVDEGAFGFIWIESGYLWLLWGGGLPLLAAFCWFVWTSLRATGPAARLLADLVGRRGAGRVHGPGLVRRPHDLRSAHHLPRLGRRVVRPAGPVCMWTPGRRRRAGDDSIDLPKEKHREGIDTSE